MEDTRIDQLSIGSLGRARYDQASSSWKFQRTPPQESIFRHIISRRVIRSPQLPNVPSFFDYSNTRYKKIKNLTDKEPVLTPAAQLLSGLGQVSEVIASVSAELDHSIGEVSAFGLASNWKDPHTPEAIPFLACASGPTGSSLRLFNVRYEPEGGERRTLCPWVILAPHLELDDANEWQDQASCPIKQICTSSCEMIYTLASRQSRDRVGHFLAIRTAARVTLFQPKTTTATGQHLDRDANFSAFGKHIQPGRLDAGYLFEIPSAWTGGSPPIDVAFSPWTQHHLVILDAMGYWTVFMITGFERRTLVYPRIMSTSALRPAVNHAEGMRLVCDDQWGRIMWAGDQKTLIACTRRELAIFTAEVHASKLSSPDLGLVEGEMILDLKRDTANPGLVFVLTSMRLVWLRLMEEPVLKLQEAKISPAVVLSWNHSWSATSSVLRLALSPAKAVTDTMFRFEKYHQGRLHEPWTAAMIYDRGSKLSEVYTTGFDSNPFVGYTLSDPFTMSFDHGERAHLPTQPLGLINILIQRIQIYSHVPKTARKSRHIEGEGDLRFFQIISTDTRLGVSEKIFGWTAPWMRTVSPLHHDAPFNLDAVGARLDAYEKLLELAEPSQDDEEEEALTTNKTVPTGYEKPNPNRYINFQWLWDYLDAQFQKRTTLSVQELQDRLPSTYNRANLSRQDPSLGQGITPIRAIFNDHGLTIDDPEEASQILAGFVSQFPQRAGPDGEHVVAAAPLLVPSMVRRITGNDPSRSDVVRGSQPSLPIPTFMDVYDYLHHTWTRPTPATAPGRARITLDRTVRQVALDVFLSSVGQRVLPELLASPPPSSGNPQVPSQPNIAPSQSQHTQEEESNPALFLSNLTALPARDPLPAVLRRITAEWDIGADPGVYDWSRARHAHERSPSPPPTGSQASQRGPPPKGRSSQLTPSSQLVPSSQLMPSSQRVPSSQLVPPSQFAGPSSSRAERPSSQTTRAPQSNPPTRPSSSQPRSVRPAAPTRQAERIVPDFGTGSQLGRETPHATQESQATEAGTQMTEVGTQATGGGSSLALKRKGEGEKGKGKKKRRVGF